MGFFNLFGKKKPKKSTIYEDYRILELLDVGELINAQIINVEEKISSKGSYMYSVVCGSYDKYNNFHNFNSDYIDVNPLPYLQSIGYGTVPLNVEVYVETDNPRNYYVNLGSILPASYLVRQ